jgi:hypothetical protein
VTVDFFLDSTTLGMPAVTRVFDQTTGMLTFEVPAGTTTVSARIHALMRDMPGFNVVDLRQYYLPIPASAVIEGDFLVRDMRALGVNLALGGGQEDPTKALLVSNARDCSGRYVSGAQFELIDGETNLPVPVSTTSGGTHVSYAQVALPSTNCTFTSSDQAAWMLGESEVELFPGGTSIVVLYRQTSP